MGAAAGVDAWMLSSAPVVSVAPCCSPRVLALSSLSSACGAGKTRSPASPCSLVAGVAGASATAAAASAASTDGDSRGRSRSTQGGDCAERRSSMRCCWRRRCVPPTTAAACVTEEAVAAAAEGARWPAPPPVRGGELTARATPTPPTLRRCALRNVSLSIGLARGAPAAASPPKPPARES